MEQLLTPDLAADSPAEQDVDLEFLSWLEQHEPDQVAAYLMSCGESPQEDVATHILEQRRGSYMDLLCAVA